MYIYCKMLRISWIETISEEILKEMQRDLETIEHMKTEGRDTLVAYFVTAYHLRWNKCKNFLAEKHKILIQTITQCSTQLLYPKSE